jgi:hypothetical protein
LYQAGQVYVNEWRYPPAFYQAWVNPTTHLVSDWTGLLSTDPDKILLIADNPAHAVAMYADMQHHFGEQMQIVQSHALFVEANPLGVHKGAGLAWLAAYLHVPQARVLTIGDHDNDAPMLAWAGWGVAMGNGSPACQAAADWIAPPLAEDGAAWALEQFGA